MLTQDRLMRVLNLLVFCFVLVHVHYFLAPHLFSSGHDHDHTQRLQPPPDFFKKKTPPKTVNTPHSNPSTASQPSNFLPSSSPDTTPPSTQITSPPTSPTPTPMPTPPIPTPTSTVPSAAEKLFLELFKNAQKAKKTSHPTASSSILPSSSSLPTFPQPTAAPPHFSPERLPLPHLLRKQFSDEELEKQFIPPGCPSLPWKKFKNPVGYQRRLFIQSPQADPWERPLFSDAGTDILSFEPSCPFTKCTFFSSLSSLNQKGTENETQLEEEAQNSTRTLTPDAVVISIFHYHGGVVPYPIRKSCPLQRYVFKSQESAANYPHINTVKDPHVNFDVTMTYHLGSDIPEPYFGFHLNWTSPPIPFHVKNQTPEYGTFFISNCHAQNRRQDIVVELMKYLPLHSYGNCNKNKILPSELDRADPRSQKISVMQNYLFNFAFENSHTDDYVTEKVFEALAAGTVPVYLGTETVDKFLPNNHSIIKVSDFKSVKDLADHLVYLREHPDKYEEYLSWKKTGIQNPFYAHLWKRKYSDYCRLCGLLRGHDVSWNSAFSNSLVPPLNNNNNNTTTTTTTVTNNITNTTNNNPSS